MAKKKKIVASSDGSFVSIPIGRRNRRRWRRRREGGRDKGGEVSCCTSTPPSLKEQLQREVEEWTLKGSRKWGHFQ